MKVTSLKDPLWTELTPYEVLDVELEATATQVNSAYKIAIPRLGRAEQAARARQELFDPAARALVDVKLYDGASSTALIPSPVEDQDALVGDRRSHTVAAWQAALRKEKCGSSVAHALAIASYWSALEYDQELLERPSGDLAKKAADTWRRALACWVACANSPYWTIRGDAPAAGGVAVGDRMLSELSRRLRDNWRTHQERGNQAVAEVYRGLELDLEAEKTAAALLGKTKIRQENPESRLTCGRVMLEMTGLLVAVENWISHQIVEHPEDTRFAVLVGVLSPHARAWCLVDRCQYGEALTEIATAGTGARSDPALIRLEVKALLGRADEYVTGGDAEAAAVLWERALARATDTGLEEVAKHVRDTVVRTCSERTRGVQEARRDEAIDLLEWALEIVPDPDLKGTAAALLCQRGISRVNSVEVDKPSAKQVKAIRAGAEDLRRAAGLAPGSTHIKDQLDTAEFFLVVVEAGDAARRDDFDGAIRIAEKALSDRFSNADHSRRDEVGQFLSGLYFGRGVATANKAMEHANRRPPSFRKMEESLDAGLADPAGLLNSPLFKDMARERGLDLAALSRYGLMHGDHVCAVHRGMIFGDVLECTLEGGKKVKLCQECADRAQVEIAAQKREAAEMLRPAVKDLERALQLDPTNQPAKDNLATAKRLFGELGGSARPATSSSQKSSSSQTASTSKRAVTHRKRSLGQRIRGIFGK